MVVFNIFHLCTGISFNICNEENYIRSYDINGIIKHNSECYEKYEDNNQIILNYFNNYLNDINLIKLNYNYKISSYLDITAGICSRTINNEESLLNFFF